MKRLLLLLLVGCAFAGRARAAEPESGVLTLDEALRLARANHPQLHAARAQTEASTARVAEAKAPLLPQVSGSASYQRSRPNSSSASFATVTGTATGTATATATSTSTSTSNAATSSGFSVPSYNAKLTASELIYDFGQTTGKWDASKATLRAQEESEKNLAVQVAFNLRSAYFTAAAARALVKVAEDTLRNQEAHLKQTQGFVEAGTHPEIDLAQARTDRANAKVQLINAQVTYDTDKALLNQTMGVERGTEYEVADPPAESVPGEDDSTDTLLPVALKARPDLLSLARQIEAQELTTKSIKGGYAPSLGVSASLSDGGSDLGNLTWGWSAALGLNWQIFGGGITDAQIREARATTAVLRAQYDLQRQQVRADVEQARLSVRAAKATIESTHEAAVNARVRLSLAEGRYKAGIGSMIELGDSQVALTSASAQEIQAVFNLATARARLLQALGQP
jgi:outer membrane protein